MIQVRGIRKRYGQQQILDGITVHFMGGHIYGLVGENGSGKTTLMRCICGFSRVDEGEIVVLEKVVGKVATLRLTQE